MSESIKVVVRVRPINSKQISLNCQTIVTADEGNNQITIVKPDEPDHVKTFAYDSVFSDNSLQSNVYAKTAYQLVENVLQGYNGTIFAYGQTGCGKTHSMVGKLDIQQLQGIIPRSFGHILNTISETKNREFLIRCSFIEIYNQQVRDLLGKDVKKSLQIKESPDKGVFIKDLSSNPAKTHEQLMDYMNLGNKNRSVGQTAMNKDSSRSHLLFMLYLQSADLSVAEQSRKYIGSKLNLVDLAGSQRINKTGAQGQRLQEAKSINLSLSALGNVISALVDGKSHHIPYRDSKLTRLLQDSLGGNTKTVMIANCSPADYNFDETISTLRYASRAKFIKNKPIINEDPKDALLKQYASQIKKLKQILNKQGGNSEIVGGNGIGQQIDEKIKQKQKQLASEKEQKRMLQERLKALEKQHLYSQNVKVDRKIKQNIKEVRQSVLLIPVNSNQLSPSDTKNIKFNSAQLRQTPTQSNGGQQNYKQIVKMLKNQIKDLQGEIEDVQHQNYLDKQLILGDIRELSKQNKLLEGIINILLSPKQLQKVKDKIEKVDRQQKSLNNGTLNNDRTVYGYNEDKNVYNIPNFVLKEKDIILPKLANQNNQDWTLGMELRNNSSINSKGNGSYVSVGPDCSEKKKSGHQSYQIQDSQDKDSNNDQEKDRLKINIRVGNVPALIIQPTSEIKNSSFMFGKGKQNSKKDNDRKELGSVRGVIQQARQVRESLLACSTITPVKKHLPSQLQPLSKADMHEKLERMMQNNKQKENRAIERPRKLQKLNNYPGSGKAALVQYIE